MKKLSLLLCMALGLWACGDDDPTTEPEPTPGTETHAPVVKIESVTPSENSVDIKFTVEDAEKAVYKVIASDAKQPTAAELLADKDASSIKVAGETVQKSGLEPNKDYVVVAAASYGETVSQLVTQSFKTEGLTFIAEMSQITWNKANYKITPSKKEGTYVIICAKKSDMATYAGKDNEFCTMYIEYLEQLVKTLEIPGLTFAKMLYTDVQEGTFTELEEDTEYVTVVFGLNADKVVTTPLYQYEFKTIKFVPTDDCTFQFEFPYIYPNNLVVKVTPSNEATRWYVYICSANELNSKTPNYLADHLIEEEINNWGKEFWAADNYIYTGTNTLNMRSDLELDELKPEQEYFAIAFGVNKQGVRTTNAFVSDMQKTPKPSIVPGLTIDISIDYDTPYGTCITYTPSDDFAGYMLGTSPKEEFIKYSETDDDFIQHIFSVYGNAIDTYSYAGPEKDYIRYAVTAGDEYVTWAFGYTKDESGIAQATTALFKLDFTEPVRTSTMSLFSKNIRKKNVNFSSKLTPHLLKLK